MKSLFHFFQVLGIPPEKKESFLFNLVLGIVMGIFFDLGKNYSVGQGIINAQFDKCIVRRMNAMTDDRLSSCPVAFLDFDEKSLLQMERPEHIPRDKVAELIRVAYEGKAKIIVLDMAFTEPDFSPGGKERDESLRNVLTQIQQDTASETKVLLPFDNYADRELKASLVSDLIDNRKIYAVTPNFTEDKKMSTVRFWLPYFDAKKKDGAPELLWSMPLTVHALLADAMEELDALKPVVQRGDKDSFVLPSDGEQAPFVFYRERVEKDGQARDAIDAQYNRIQYFFLPPEEMISTRDYGNLPRENVGHWRAKEKNHINNQCFDARDKIVIIGRTDPDCGDFHATPVGTMPGMYVHGNSIMTLTQETRPHLAPAWAQRLVDFLLVVITAYAYVRLSPTKSKIFIFLLTGTAAVLTYQYFRVTNAFVYLSFSFLSIGAYKFVLEFLLLLQKWKEKGAKQDAC